MCRGRVPAGETVTVTRPPVKCSIEGHQRIAWLMEMSSAKLATLETDAMNAAAGAGAPSYVSGAQKWNGTAAILKPRPAAIMTSAIKSSGVPPLADAI